MAVIVLCSASGSPGVTTTAVAMALNWPRPVVLVEADPTGGSGILAGFMRGTVEYDVGLIELALSPLNVVDGLREVMRPIASEVSFVAGVRTPAQARALLDLWPTLAGVLSDLDASGTDVMVDAGRLGLEGSPRPLIEEADLTLLVTRGNLPALAAARAWADQARSTAAGWRQAGLLLVGEGRPYRAQEVTKVLGLPVVTDLPDDTESAAVYHRGAAPPKRFETGSFLRAVQAGIQAIRAHTAREGFGQVRFSLVEGSGR
jgi:hypothetical protein